MNMHPRVRKVRNKKTILIFSILLIATCLRAPFTSMGPLLGMIQESLAISSAATGFVNALPLIAFALVSPLAPMLSQKLGLEKTLGIALLFVGFGTLLRTISDLWILYLGTIFIGCGIAIANVLLPSLVKRSFPSYIPKITALYALSMGISAAIGSAFMIPLSDFFTLDWNIASSFLFIFPLAAGVMWLPQVINAKQITTSQNVVQPQKNSLLKSGLTWQVTLFFGLTSLTYYVIVSWLPALLKDAGFTEVETGNIHGLMQLASAFPGLILVPIVRRSKDERLISLIMAGIAAVGSLGLAVLPKLALIWGICVGFGFGATIILGLMFIGLRTQNTLQAAALSGMSQSFGYLLAAFGPIGAGLLHDITQSWIPVFYLCTATSVLLGIFGLGAGRSIRIEQKIE